MNERSVQVVISGHGEQRVRLRVHDAAPDRPVAVQLASLCPLVPTGQQGATAGTRESLATATRTILLELRWSEPAPPPIQPEPRSEPAPLATAWALAQRHRQRRPSSSPPATARVRGRSPV
jgi:hypothetical protein